MKSILRSLRFLAVTGSVLPMFAADYFWDPSAATGTFSSSKWHVGINTPPYTQPWSDGNAATFSAASQVITVSSPITVSGLNATANNIVLDGAATMTVGAATSVTVSSGNTFTIDAPLGGAGSLTVSGGGKLVLGGSNSYAGGTTLSAGTLVLNTATALGTGSLTIGNNATIDTAAGPLTLSNNNLQTWSGHVIFGGTSSLNLGSGTITLPAGEHVLTIGGGTLTIPGNITGAGGILVSGQSSGFLVLSGANTYTGNTTIASTVFIASNSAFGTGTISFSGGSLQGQGGARTLANNYSVNSNGANFGGSTDITLTGAGSTWVGHATAKFLFNSTGNVVISGPIDINNSSGSRTLNLEGANNGTISGVIKATGTGTGGLTKNGVGTVTLSGASTYTGATTVAQGRLWVTGSLPTGSAVSVAGGTLGGTGTIGGATTLASGTIAPGTTSTGLLTFSNSVTLTGGRLHLEIAGTSRGANYDAINVGGAFTAGGVLDVAFIEGFDPAVGASFDLIDAATISGTFGTVVLPPLPGRAWNTSALYTTGIVSVIAATDSAAPALVSIARQSPLALATAATSVTWRVTFSKSVTGVDADDFALSGTPAGTLSVSPVSGSVYDITAGSLTGAGALRLDLKSTATISDSSSTPIAPTGFYGGASFLRGAADSTAPTVTTISRLDPTTASTGSDVLVFRVTFSEAVQDVDASDFTLNLTGDAAGTIAAVSAPSEKIYHIAVRGVTGTGGVRLDLKNIGTGITDLAGNAIAAGFSTGDAYSVAPHPSGSTTILVSRQAGDRSDTSVSGAVGRFAISGDGRYAAFVSAATDLMVGANDTASNDLFLHDRETGVVRLISHTATDVSAGLSSGVATFGTAATFGISDDGRFVVFTSTANNVVTSQSEGNSGDDVFLYDRHTGTSTLVSRTAANAAKTGNGASNAPVISGDGRYVAFISMASDLVSGQSDTQARPDVFLYERETGVVRLVSHAASSVTTAATTPASATPLIAISADGRYVAFTSVGTNLVSATDSGTAADVFLYDRTTQANVLVSHADGAATTFTNAATLSHLGISGDGRRVVYISSAGNLVASPTPDALADVFLYDRQSDTHALVSHLPGSALAEIGSAAAAAQISRDGNYVAFASAAQNQIVGQSAGTGQKLFLYDRAADTHALVSHVYNSTVTPSGSASTVFSLSADARYVLFHDSGTNLVPGTDTNGGADCFLYDRLTANVRLASHVATDSLRASDRAMFPDATNVAISLDGSRALFFTVGNEMVAGRRDLNAQVDLFSYQVSDSTVGLVSGIPVPRPDTTFAINLHSVSDDGRFAVGTSTVPNLAAGVTGTLSANHIYLYDAQSGDFTLISHAAGTPTVACNSSASNPAISGDGRYIVFLSNATNLVNGGTETSFTDDIFLYDRQTSTVTLVSHRATSLATAAGGAAQTFQPLISPDGAWIVFGSSANNLVAGQTDTNSLTDVFLYERATGAITLVNHSNAGATTTTAGGFPSTSAAVLSDDGRYVAFTSTQTNHVPGQVDAGASLDIFLFDRETAAITLVTRSASGSASVANAAFTTFAMDGSGRYVVFSSAATDVVSGQVDTTNTTDVFLYDRQADRVSLVSHTSAGATTAAGQTLVQVTISPDGRFIGFTSNAALVSGATMGGGSGVYLYELATDTFTLASAATGATLGNANAANLTSSRNSFSRDGRYLVFNSNASNLIEGQIESVTGTTDTFLFDRIKGSVTLASHAAGSSLTGSEASASVAQIARDGAIYFQSVATTLASERTTPGKSNIYRFPLPAPVPLEIRSVVAPANGAYAANSILTFTVNLKAPVTITGAPRLALTIGSTTVYAVYDAANSTSTSLKFNYTVQPGDGDANGIAVASPLQLNGGTIKDDLSEDIALAFTAPTTTSLLVDTAAPTLAQSTPLDNATGVSRSANLVLTFSESVLAGTGNIILRPATGSDISIPIGSAQVSLSGTTVTINPTSDLAEGMAYDVIIADGVIKDAAGNTFAGLAADALDFTTASAVDTTAPTIVSVTSSTPNGTYKIGDAISIQVTFSEAVVVTGTPKLKLETGGNDDSADFSSGSSTNTLTFTYTVLSLAETLDLNYHSTAALTLNGGTIKDGANNAAVLTLPALTAVGSLGVNKAIVLDGRRPALAGINRETPSTLIVPAATSLSWRVAFNESVTGVDANDFSLAGAVTGTLSVQPSSPSHVVTLSNLSGTGAVQLNVRSDATITDQAGNAPTSFALTGMPFVLGSAVEFPFASTSITNAGDTGFTGNASHDVTELREGYTLVVDGATFSIVRDPESEEDGIVANPTDVAATSGDKVTLGLSNGGTFRLHGLWFTDLTLDSAAHQFTFKGYNGTTVLGTLSVASTQLITSWVVFDASFAGLTHVEITQTGGARLKFFLREVVLAPDAPADSTAPTFVSSTPANGDTNVAVDAAIALTFSENVTAGTGNIIVRPAGGSGGSIAITDATQVTFSGSTVTINPAGDFAAGTTYNVFVETGRIKDAAGNSYAHNDSALLTFTTVAPPDTTAPTLVTRHPEHDATEVSLATNVVLEFSEPIVAGSGSIVLRPSSGSDVTIALNDAAQLWIVGATLTLDPATELLAGRTYDVIIPSGAIKDAAGNTFAGLTAGALRFRTAGVAPTIATHPQSKTAAGLQSTSLTVAASGTAPFAYQWFKDDVALDGQIFPTLTLPYILLKDAGAYKVKVTNPVGSVTSDVATLTVAPYVLNSSPDRSAGLGGKHTFFVAAAGSGTLTYQWYKGDTAIENATGAEYTIDPVTVAHAGSYKVKITGAGDPIESPAAVLTVLPNPIVYQATAAIAGTNGVAAYFSIEGTQPKKLVIAAYGPALTSTSGAITDPQIVIENASGTSLATNDNWGAIEDTTFSATYSRLSLTPLASGSKDAVVYRSFDAGSYRVRVTGVGNATGTVNIAIADADLNPPSRLAYVALRGPVSDSTPLAGGFTLVNSADKKLLFRAIGPALGSSGLADPTVKVFDSNGTTIVTSNDNWGGGPTLVDAFAQAGAFALAADSKDAALLGAMRIGTGSYTAQVTGAAGTSGDVLWEVYDLNGTTPSTSAPIIVATPASQSVTGGNVTFHALAAGGGPLAYKWKKGTVVIDGATTATLTLNNVTAADAADYTVEVSNTAGIATATASLHYVPSIASVTGPTAASYKAGATLGFTVAFTGNVTVTGTPRLALTLGSATVYAIYSASGSSVTSLIFNYTVAAGDADTDGIASAGSIDLNGGSIKDSANNNVGLTFTAPTLSAVLVDTTAPTVILGSSAPALTNVSPLPLTITFSESVTGFAASDLVVSGATVGAIAGSGASYTTSLTPTGDGPITVDLAANSATDAAGNGNSAATQLARAFDGTAPTLSSVTIASNNANSTWAKVGDVVTVTFTATEAIGTPTATVAGRSATVSNTAGNTWTASITTAASDTEGVIAFSLGFSDLIGNAGAAVTATTNSSSVTFDRTAPNAPAFTAIGEDNGSSTTDRITSDTTLSLSGTAESGSAITITRVGTGVVGTATANGSGAWSFDYSGTVLDAGMHTFTAAATDAAGNVSATPGSLAVTILFQPVLSVGAAPKGVYNQAFSYQIVATNNPASYAASGLPSGLTLDTTTGAISGKPTVTGTFTVTLSATNAVGTGSATFDLVVDKAAQTVAFAELPERPATDAPFALAATATSGLPVTYAVAHGPATISGNTVTLSGGRGLVLITATQDGNESYSAAPAQTRGFIVGPHASPRLRTFAAAAVRGSVSSDGTSLGAFTSTDPMSFVRLVFDPANLQQAAAIDGTIDVTIAQARLIFDRSRPFLFQSGNAGLDNPAFDPIPAVTEPGTATLKITPVTGEQPIFKFSGTLNIPASATAAAGTLNISGAVTPKSDGSYDIATLSLSFAYKQGPMTITGKASNGVEFFDLGAPPVTDVRAVSVDGAYRVGATLTFAVTFDKTVNVTGTPQLQLATGRTGAVATYTSGSGTDTLTFTYVVADGDNTADLDYAATTALELNGGTIRDALGFDATLTLPAPGSAGSLAARYNLALDTTRPPVAAITAVTENTSSLLSPAITSDTTLTLSGTAEAGATIAVFRAGVTTAVASATAGSDGKWSAALSSSLSDGSHTFTAYATDAAGNISEVSAYFAVVVDTAAPVLSSAVTASGTYKSPFTFTVVASGAAKFAATGLPAGLAIDVATGVISGTPTESGGFNVALTATDLAGNSSTGALALTIAKINLTVAGVVVLDKAYDGSVNATLNFSGASLVGVVSGDTVTLVSSGATGTFADANAAGSKSVTIAGLTLSGTHASHYTLTQPTATASIARALVVITISNLNHVYDGTTKSPSVSVVPAVAHNVNVGGAPIGAGSYSVTVNVTDPNFSGSQSATLTIAKGTQTVALSAPATGKLGTPSSVSATASSGLPVTLAVGGPATLSGSTLTFTAPGSVTVTATQAGNENFAAASATATITVAGKLAQTIAFGAPSDRLSNSGTFGLNATATSGLPVTFAIVGGPAMLSGNTITLTGAAGRVIVRASQPGDAVYEPAPDVSVGFTVTAATLNVFFGTVTQSGNPTKAGDVAATMPPNSNKGSLLVVAPGMNVNTVLDFTLNPDGTFTQTIVVDAPATGSEVPNTPARAAASLTLTVRGSLVNGQLQGVIEPLGLSFNANVLPVAGPSANAAGLYKSSTLANTNGSTYSIVGTNNEVLVLAKTPEVTTGGLTTLNADGTFGLQTATTAGTATIRGTVDEPTTTVAGTISLPGRPETSFAGLVVTTTRTDRLVNLSSRVRIGGGDRVLITGFVIGGAEPKQVLVRGVGPGLAGFGVQGALANPRIRIYRDGALIAENDDWAGAATGELASAFTRLGAFALNSGSADAALLATLPPGAYTAQVLGGSGQAVTAGVALAEIYDASVNPNSEYQRLVNISTRGEAGTGENVLIGGFIVTGNSPKKMLIRGIGPGLAAFGVGGTLADPRLRVFRASEVLAENDNWSAGGAEESAAIVEAARVTGAFALPADSRDAALILTLAPGQYTAQVAPNGTSAAGVALVEIYEIPE